MSTSINSRARALLPSLPVPRPRLTLVPKTATPARRLPFVVFVMAVLGAGLVGLLLLNTSMERGAFTVTSLRAESATLSAQQQNLQLQVAALQDPQKVAERALRLGMVQNPSPAFLSLATGQVLGKSEPGTAAGRFDIGAKIGPSVDRLGKVDPLVGGEANGAAGGVVEQSGTQSGNQSGRQSGAANGTAAEKGSATGTKGDSPGNTGSKSRAGRH